MKASIVMNLLAKYAGPDGDAHSVAVFLSSGKVVVGDAYAPTNETIDIDVRGTGRILTVRLIDVCAMMRLEAGEYDVALLDKGVVE